MKPAERPGWDVVRLPQAAADGVAQALAGSAQSLDPYLLWHAATHPNPESVVPVAIEFIAGSGWENDPLLRRIVPAHYRGRRFGTARVAVAAELLTLLGTAYNGMIRRIRLGRAWQSPELHALAEADDAARAARLSGRVMAVIDDGCAFAHERFRRLDAQGRWHTRIQHLWDQGRRRHQVPQDSGWQPVAEFGYGHELRAADIDALLARRTGADAVVDEDAVYRDADEDRSKARELHGTHVLDLAAGRAPADTGEAPQIIFVQLPRKAVRDTSGGWLNTHVLDALWYVHSRVADDAQLVVNLSFGAMAGPHDASSILEQSIDDFCALRSHDFALVLPAGNAHDSDCHARLELPAAGRGSFTFRVRPDDPTDSFVELYVDRHAGVQARLLPPGLAPGPATPGNAAWVHHDAQGLPQCALVHVAGHGDETESRLVAMLAPCDPQDREIGKAPSGDWQLELTNLGAQAVTVHAWIERDGRSDGWPYPGGSQARFLDDAPGPEGATQRARLVADGTLNSIAHGLQPVVVGACVGSEPLKLAGYSGSGPSRAPQGRAGPDVVAISEEWPTYNGVVAAGSRSGIRFRQNGSSVAAPQVARWILDALLKPGKPLTKAQIREQLRAAAAQMPLWPADPARCGAGCIDPEHRAARQR
jgi:hypothetical protein